MTYLYNLSGSFMVHDTITVLSISIGLTLSVCLPMLNFRRRQGSILLSISETLHVLTRPTRTLTGGTSTVFNVYFTTGSVRGGGVREDEKWGARKLVIALVRHMGAHHFSLVSVPPLNQGKAAADAAFEFLHAESSYAPSNLLKSFS